MDGSDRNVGTIDRVLRVALGLAMLGSPLAWYGLDYISNWGFLGLYPLITGLLGTCPLYRAIGVRTSAG